MEGCWEDRRQELGLGGRRRGCRRCRGGVDRRRDLVVGRLVVVGLGEGRRRQGLGVGSRYGILCVARAITHMVLRRLSTRVEGLLTSCKNGSTHEEEVSPKLLRSIQRG